MKKKKEEEEDEEEEEEGEAQSGKEKIGQKKKKMKLQVRSRSKPLSSVEMNLLLFFETSFLASAVMVLEWGSQEVVCVRENVLEIDSNLFGNKK